MEIVRTALMSIRDPFSELQAEALLKANKEFDFSEYDLDRDSVITSNELAILIVVPQTSSSGSNAILKFRPYCSGDPLMVDDVEIRSLVQWYTPAMNNGATPEQDLDSIMAAVHELAHLVLGLDDAYGLSEAIYAGWTIHALSRPGRSPMPDAIHQYCATSPLAHDLQDDHVESPP